MHSGLSVYRLPFACVCGFPRVRVRVRVRVCVCMCWVCVFVGRAGLFPSPCFLGRLPLGGQKC